MSGTIALMVAWLHFNGSFVNPQPIEWATTNKIPRASYFIGYAPISGAVCPIHGPLAHESWGEALTFAGSDDCHTRPVCIRCLLAAINAPDSCIPNVEVLR